MPDTTLLNACHRDSVTVERLQHCRKDTAESIAQLLQRSYQVEAALIGTKNFPPLSRSPDDIQQSKSTFMGLLVAGKIAAVIELEATSGNDIEICSMVTAPEKFKQGLATRLLEEVFTQYPNCNFLVTTGQKNFPAINLYRKLGFVEIDIWQTQCGIAMLSLIRPNLRQ
jgi:ribosomal protein S18 acetylase RimI-like enzyme